MTGQAEWAWYDFTGRRLSHTVKKFEVKGINSAHLVSYVGIDKALPPGHTASNSWLHLVLTGNRSNGQRFTNEQFFNPISLAQAPLRDPRLRIQQRVHSNSTVEHSRHDFLDAYYFDITAEGDGVAAWVSLEHPEGVLGWFESVPSDPTEPTRPSNAFWLRPGEIRQVRFKPRYDRTGGKWADEVKVRSMWQTQQT